MDPAKPQNRQPFVKYIEDEQKSINELLHFLERSNHQKWDSAYSHGYYNQPEHVPKIENYHLDHKAENKYHKSPQADYGKPKKHYHEQSSMPTIQDYTFHNDDDDHDQYEENENMNTENENRGYLDSDESSSPSDNQPEEGYQEESEGDEDLRLLSIEQDHYRNDDSTVE